MNSKKAITLLILATLLLALVPVFPVKAALTTNSLADFNVVYDEKVTVSGSGVTPGSTIELYWDYVQAWDGEAGLIGSDSGLPSGDFEIEFDTPEAVVGNHYLWIKDVSTGETVKVETDAGADNELIMDPSIELDNENGLAGATVEIKGYGFNATTDIRNILFGNNTVAGGGSGIGSAIHENTTTGLPETDDLGSWTEDYTIPSPDTKWYYGTYNIYAVDETNNQAANTSFTIGASIELNKDEGPTGTVVRITGEGFTAGVDLDINDVTFNTTGCYVIDSPVEIEPDGTFTLDCVIPSDDPVSVGESTIQVTDGVYSPTVDFECTGLPDMESDPAFQVQGGMFTVTGTNFTMLADEEITFYLNNTHLGEVETESDGTFEAELRVPAVTSGVYNLAAQMTGFNINHNISYRVGIMLVILSEESGPTGSQITVTATGFTHNGDWNMTVGGVRPDEISAAETADSDGSLSKEFTIPTLPVGVQTVSVYDVDADIAVETEFEVTHTTMLEADPYEVPYGFNVTLSGEYFADNSLDETLEFWLYNATHAFELTVYNESSHPNNVGLLDDGTFEGIWTTDAAENFTVGTYTINATDGKGLYAELSFEIVDDTVDIESRKATFAIGETVAFDIESSFPVLNSYIKIMDPAGDLYWQTEAFASGVWVELELTRIVPFYSQTAGGNPMLLLDDAPLGEYMWEWYNSDDEVIDEGVFTVTAAAADIISEQVADLNNDIADLADQLTDVAGEFSSLESEIADVASVAADAVAAAEAAAEAVTAVAATANTASEAAANAAEAAEAARDAASGLTTLVYGAIGAALVAALAAIVSLMQISRRIAG